MGSSDWTVDMKLTATLLLCVSLAPLHVFSGTVVQPLLRSLHRRDVGEGPTTRHGLGLFSSIKHHSQTQGSEHKGQPVYHDDPHHHNLNLHHAVPHHDPLHHYVKRAADAGHSIYGRGGYGHGHHHNGHRHHGHHHLGHHYHQPHHHHYYGKRSANPAASPGYGYGGYGVYGYGHGHLYHGHGHHHHHCDHYGHGSYHCYEETTYI